MTTAGAVTPVRMLTRGIRKRCPACGSGHLFTGYFNLVERCPGCGLRLHRHEGQMTGDIGVNTVVTLVLMFFVLLGAVFGLGSSVPIGRVIVIGGVVVLGFPVFFLPYSKTIWLAIDVATHPDAVNATDESDDVSRPGGPGTPPATGA